MDCNIIHACKMGCILYRGVYADLQDCPKCSSPRYTQVPTKKLRHFLIIPHLIRFYHSLAISKLLVWHTRTKAWMVLSDTWWILKHECMLTTIGLILQFDLKNIRFGLATNGFNPFSNKTCIWSTWPVMLLVYKSPSWMATKRVFMLLALLIFGKK